MDSKEMRRRVGAGEDPLEVSIRKFQDIAEGTGTNEGSDNCALCYMYRWSDCALCPVYKAIGISHCRETPYEDYVKAKTDEERYEAAKREVAFLESLRDR